MDTAQQILGELKRKRQIEEAEERAQAIWEGIQEKEAKEAYWDYFSKNDTTGQLLVKLLVLFFAFGGFIWIVK